MVRLNNRARTTDEHMRLDKPQKNTPTIYGKMKRLRKLFHYRRPPHLAPHQGGSIEYSHNAFVAEQPAAQEAEAMGPGS